jgi:dephospho-CoA kinase
VVSASPLLQRQRVMRRAGMTQARFAAILKQQMPDREKRRRADFVVQSGLSRALTLRRLKAILRLLLEKGKSGHARGCARYRNDRPRPR